MRAIIGALRLAARRWVAALGGSGALRASPLLVLCAMPAAAEPGTTRLLVYFNNERLASDPYDCTAVFAVSRTLPRTSAVATAALRALFAGPTPQEHAVGYRSPFSAATAGLLKSVRIERGTVYLDLNDLRVALAGATSSCGAAELRTQLLRTLRQFPTVHRVIVAIDGNPRTFYEWMNEECGPANDGCDPRPFRPGT